MSKGQAFLRLWWTDWPENLYTGTLTYSQVFFSWFLKIREKKRKNSKMAILSKYARYFYEKILSNFSLFDSPIDYRIIFYFWVMNKSPVSQILILQIIGFFDKIAIFEFSRLFFRIFKTKIWTPGNMLKYLCANFQVNRLTTAWETPAPLTSDSQVSNCP